MSRRAVLVVVALAVAALSTALLTVYVRAADDRAAAGNDLQQVLVADQEIPAGLTGQQVLDGGYVAPEEIPSSAVLDESMSRIDSSLYDLRLETRILPGEQLQTSRFRASPATNLQIPPGKMALSIGLDDAARVAGNVESGSNVAVFVTLSGGGGETQLLVESVQVLDVGTAGADSADGSGPLLTLAVDQLEAQRLIYAQNNGRLYVGLRGDETTTQSLPPVNGGNLFPPG